MFLFSLSKNFSFKITYEHNKETNNNPGTIPEIKSLPIDSSVIDAYNNIGIEGGINIPKVPEAAINP